MSGLGSMMSSHNFFCQRKDSIPKGAITEGIFECAQTVTKWPKNAGKIANFAAKRI
jgi:hypothetical protein